MNKLMQESSFIQRLIFGYFSCIVAGWLILQLPICQSNVVSGLDTFFTTASAISTTGLVTIDIGKSFTLYGQWVLLLLMQLGGIGYMLLSSFIALNIEQKAADFRQRNVSSSELLSRGITKQVIAYTIICEVLGSAVLYVLFKNEGIDNSFWNAIFHSVSAFCTAGFSLFTTNLETFKHHIGINITLSILSILGAFGFFLWFDFIKKLQGEKKTIGALARMTRSFAAVAISIGTLLFLVLTSSVIEDFWIHRLNISFFQTMSAVTTVGFNTINVKYLPNAALVFLIILMLCGASLTSRNRNMRSTSFVVLLRLMFKIIAGKSNRKRLLKSFSQRIQISTSVFISFVIILLCSFTLLILIEKQPFLPLLFEVASALCTVGLSTGITTDLTIVGKSLLILLMLLGRASILIFGFSVAHQTFSSKPKAQPQELVV